MIKIFQFSRISTRITVFLVLILVLTFGSYTAFTIYFGQKRSTNVFIEQTSFLGKTVERILRINMLENQREDIQLAINEIQQSGNIRQIRLFDHEGEIFYSTDKKLIGTSVGITDEPCNSCHTGYSKKLKTNYRNSHSEFKKIKNEISVNIPIFNSETCSSAPCHVHPSDQKLLGVLSFDVLTERTMADLKFFRTMLILVSLIVILFTAIVVFLLLKHWVWQPVQKMVEGTQRIASGNLDEPIPPGKAEIGLLAESFNNMQAQLKVTQRHLVMCEKLASVGKLAAGVAHEINNPLTGILTFSESLLEEASPEDPRRSDYEVIRQQSLRSRDIVRKILDFARQDEPLIKNVQINNIVDNTVSLVRRLTQFQNIQIVTRFDETIPETLLDPGQIEQVVLNMLINSSEAITSGGRIEVITSLSQSRHEIIITLKDNGAGIEKKNLTKIFDPFFSTKKSGDSSNSGLGLSVSWGIVEQHGGRIEVDSKIGTGTTFRIILPVRKG